MYFYFDKRILYGVLAVLVIWGLSSYIFDIYSILRLLYTIPGVLIAITFHEFAHAKAADILGDDTPRREGRLSLNPLSHIDPVGFIMLLFAGFGWGKPVNVNPRNYNRDITVEKADVIVSISGPLTNIVLATVLTVFYFAIYKISLNTGYISKTIEIVMEIIQATVLINIGLGIFNLIPLPPLDGSKIIKIFLPYNAKQWFENNERFFYIGFIILWVTGITRAIITPIILKTFDFLMNIGGFLFGI